MCVCACVRFRLDLVKFTLSRFTYYKYIQYTYCNGRVIVAISFVYHLDYDFGQFSLTHIFLLLLILRLLRLLLQMKCAICVALHNFYVDVRTRAGVCVFVLLYDYIF